MEGKDSARKSGCMGAGVRAGKDGQRQTRGRVSVMQADSKTQTLKIGRQTEK